MTKIQEKLFALRDEKYQAFQCRLMPTVPPETCIGVRTPELRRYAKELWRGGDWEAFLAELPHRYYDENNLHGFLLCELRDYDRCVAELDRFLPYVDNWATCDLLSPRVLPKHPERLLADICRWMASAQTYTVRFGMEMLMSHFLDARFRPEYLELAAAVCSEEYYVNMMTAWFFATALAKQYDAAIPYVENRVLEPWVHRKTIQKAIESYRLTDAQKAYLRTLK